MQFLVAQIGARRHYAVPRALQAAGLLGMLHADACAEVAPWRYAKLVPGGKRLGPVAGILGRKTNDIPRNQIRGDLRYLMRAYIGPARRKRGESNVEFWIRKNRIFCLSCLRDGFAGCDAVYIYNGAGLEILQEAKRRGFFCVVDQTSAAMRHDARLLSEEAARWPDWATDEDSMEGWEAMAAREEAEWALADRIICGSTYVAETVVAAGGRADACRVVPYGIDMPQTQRAKRKAQIGSEAVRSEVVSSVGPQVANPQSAIRNPHCRLRVLFAGTLCLRKGVPYLYECMERLVGESVEFRIAGLSQVTETGLTHLRKYGAVLGAVPRSAMREHYGWADVFLLPTLSEGSANVCYEALAHGVPVVTTPNAGAIVKDGVDGHICPIRDPAAMAGRLRALAHDRALLARLSDAAAKTAADRSRGQYNAALTKAILPAGAS
jgi:glycosyltransferase involved in cell wall biosynthesis